MNFLDVNFNQTKSTEIKNATVLFQRNVVLNSNQLEKLQQLGSLFSNFLAAFKIVGPKFLNRHLL